MTQMSLRFEYYVLTTGKGSEVFPYLTERYGSFDSVAFAKADGYGYLILGDYFNEVLAKGSEYDDNYDSDLNDVFNGVFYFSYLQDAMSGYPSIIWFQKTTN